VTIMATHFAIVLGAWRLRVRIDLDEPRESELKDEPAPQAQAAALATHPVFPQIATWGRG
jgi:hypothetical protein